MAHRRKHRRHRRARENPLEDSTKIFIAVGVTAAVVGVGYYLYKRNQNATAGAQQFAPQLAGADATRGTPPPGANAGGSSSTDQQQKQQIQLFKLGDAAGSATNANTTADTTPLAPAVTQAMSYRQTMNSVYYPPAPPDGVHATRYLRDGGGGGGGPGDADEYGYLNQ